MAVSIEAGTDKLMHLRDWETLCNTNSDRFQLNMRISLLHTAYIMHNLYLFDLHCMWEPSIVVLGRHLDILTS